MSERLLQIRLSAAVRQIDELEAEVTELESMYDAKEKSLEFARLESERLAAALEDKNARMVDSRQVEAQIDVIRSHINAHGDTPIIQIIKLVRTMTNPPMGLREAKDFVDSLVANIRDRP